MTTIIEGESGLYVTDAELIRRLGVPEKIARDAIKMLDGRPDSGFPKKQELWGHRRYWPAVRQYFDVHYGLKTQGNRHEQAHDYRARISAAAQKVGMGGRVAGS